MPTTKHAALDSDGPAVEDRSPVALVQDLNVVVLGTGRSAMRYVRRTLGQLTHSCHVANNVEEALLQVFAEVPDVVVLDCTLPVQSFEELAERMVPTLLADQLPIVWIGDGREDVHLLHPELGEVVLDPPFTEDDLAEALSTAQWTSLDGKPRIGVSDRPTRPFTPSVTAPVGPGADGNVQPRRKTAPFHEPNAVPMDGRPRRGSGSGTVPGDATSGTTDELRNLTPEVPVDLPDQDDESERRTRADAQSISNTHKHRALPESIGGGRGKPRNRRALRTHDVPTKNSGIFIVGALIDGRYRLEEALGRGGTARVYRAYDVELDETVALKVLRSDIADDTVRRRFRREMRISRRLIHPNIVRAYEFGSFQGRLYYTMELLDGADMAELMCQRPRGLSIKQAVMLMAQTCDGLAAAHAVGIVHRDIKPHNLFVIDDNRRIKVTDFGVAKGQSDNSQTITHTDFVVGTPAYLSPERLADDVELSPVTDLYALGASMYHMFTGRLPFTGPDLSTMLTAIVRSEPPAPRNINPMIPKTLEAIIRRAMHKEPSRRYADCSAMKAALMAVVRELGR